MEPTRIDEVTKKGRDCWEKYDETYRTKMGERERKLDPCFLRLRPINATRSYICSLHVTVVVGR